MLPEQQQRILGYFIEEATDHLNTIEQGLLNLQSTLNDPDLINEVFRAAHSIKGGAAMLGLNSIQRTSHRLEDCFKVLKDNPVKIDQKLESLFLGVSDTLKALLEHLSGPFGLTEEAANTLMAEAEPVFGWLNEHLDKLVKQSTGGNGPSGGSGNDATPQAKVQQTTSPGNKNSELQAEVLNKLRQILQLFKQPATPESRQSLQECTDYLAQLGDKWNLSTWSNLCRSATRAIAFEENTYLTLAKIVITEIKQALELVLDSRENEIVISEQLEALLPAAEIELLEIGSLEFDEPDTELLVKPQADNYEEVAAVEALHLTDIKDELDSNSQIAADTVEAENNIESLFELSDQFNDNNDNVDRDAPTVIHQLNIHGPEVGIAELNTLADLFEGESSELDESWQQEEILNLKADKSQKDDAEVNLEKVEDTDSDFEDFLLFEEEINKNDQTTVKEEMTIMQLFGDDFLESDLENFKDTANKEFSDDDLFTDDLQQVNHDEEINDLLELNFDGDDGNVSEDELNSLLNVNTPKLEQSDNQTGNFEDLNHTSGFDDLFADTPASDVVTENAPQEERFDLPSFDEVGLDTLFGEFEKPKPDEIDGDLFDDSDQVPVENSSIGEEVTVEEHPTQIIPREDVAKALEDNLLEVTNSGDIFAENESSETVIADSELEDLDSNFDLASEVQFDSIFSGDTIDDFLELALSGDTGIFENANDDELFASEVDNSQQPSSVEEDLFAIPSENDNLLEENTEVEAQKPSSVEEDLLVISSEKENQVEENTKDAQPEISDNPFTQESSEIDSVESPESSQILQSPFDVEMTEEVSFNIDSPNDLEDIEANFQAQLIDDLFAQDLQFDDEITLQATSKEQEITFLPFTKDDNQDEANLAEYTAVTEKEIQQESQETQLQELSISDNFTELESLLEQEKFPNEVNNDLIPDADFAALEDLLVLDNPQPEETTVSDTPAIAKNEASSNIGDEFSDLEKLLKQANTSIPRTNQVKPASPKNTRSAKGEQLMRVPVKHLDNLSNLVGELVVNRNTLEQDQERMRQSLDNLLHQIQNLSDVGARMQELYERSLLEASLLATRKDSGFAGSTFNTDRGFSELEMDRFTPFHTLSQEMIELIVRVRESASDIDFVVEDNERVARQFRQVTSQLQEGITRSRMEAFSQVTTRLERGVRDNSIKYGKQVQLLIEGQDTLIDKMILQHLTDPLTHILNNAIAHGIETPEQRKSRGKPEQGTIKIRAFHQGNQTVISVSDDGAGIDAEKVKKKAAKVGLITPEQAKTISRMEVYELLFHSGFSTKDEADQLAGRGVGMDVVRTSISEIRGAISTDSSLGKGTKFTIRLPLTLSICKALCCVSDKARIAFAMDGVEDTVDMPVKSIKEDADGKKYILWRDTKLPFRPLKELLTFNRLLSRGNVYGGNRDDDMVSVIVVRSANTMIALQIDQVLSEQEIVIKQFEGPAPKPIGVAGATVLGDGRIMPIVDVLELIDIFEGRTSKQSSVSLWDQKDTLLPADPVDAKIDPTVLIVDDSITVRELLSLTFSKAGYRVEQARDGQEAWDKLRSGLPCDIVFCDIEMPRCDGLELLSRIQKNPDLNDLPIAMLTSRGADKHRQMAIQLGASGYFTKPYLEEALLEAAVRMLKGEKLVASS
jgi:chemosensory pili system protein ChpA (sensor histidine kinase/response regulator)